MLALLFSQLALAHYVCPGQDNTQTMAAMMASGEPCEGMDPAQPALCHQHSAGAAQSFEVVKLPAASLPAFVQVLILPLVPDADQSVAAPITSTPDARPPPDPLFLSTLRLRV
ncbi:MAG: hypothetical protein QFE16_17230 [Pseudomonadota bacterium]|nr:hypothetical protein [Pseudomonadota bacterium]